MAMAPLAYADGVPTCTARIIVASTMPRRRERGIVVGSKRNSSHSTAAIANPIVTPTATAPVEAGSGQPERRRGLQKHDDRDADPLMPRPIVGQPRNQVEHEQRDAGDSQTNPSPPNTAPRHRRP